MILKSALFALVVVYVGVVAVAAPSATFVCKMKRGPANVYKFKTEQLIKDMPQVTFVETHRFMEQTEGQTVRYDEIINSGIAMNVTKSNSDTETLVLGSMTFEFIEGVLQNCNQ